VDYEAGRDLAVVRNAVFARRGDAPGDKVFYIDKEGLVIGHELYMHWMGPRMKPGETVTCTCDPEAIHLGCPIHAIAMGDDFEGL
jgi:hypothetical protein